MNELYGIIADNIRNYCDITFEENYAKFIVEYYKNFKQRNKEISKIFIEGLNKNNLKNYLKNLYIFLYNKIIKIYF